MVGDNLEDVVFSTPRKPSASASTYSIVRGTNISIARTT